MLNEIYFSGLCLLCTTLTWTDLRYGIIPNWLNVTIAALGLSKAVLATGWLAAVGLVMQGFAIGIIIWLLRWSYFRVRRVQGLGLGDVKFLAAAGIWVGLAGLPVLLLIATLGAAAAAGILVVTGQQMTARSAIPFGPFLAIGLVVSASLQQLSLCC